jgi:hypothetical protein
MIKPSEFRNILVDVTDKRVPKLPIDWTSQASPPLEVSLIELVKLANDCREEAAKLQDFADYVDRLWEIRSVEEERLSAHLCDTCTKYFATCNGAGMVWGHDVDPDCTGAFKDYVLKCDSYRPR